MSVSVAYAAAGKLHLQDTGAEPRPSPWQPVRRRGMKTEVLAKGRNGGAIDHLNGDGESTKAGDGQSIPQGMALG